jgi:hypothetical protein
VTGQRLMQTSGDIFLGSQRVPGLDGQDLDLYVRQLLDWKGSAVIDRMRPKGMATYAAMCGWTLARAHARSGDRIAIAAYLGPSSRFDEAVAHFAEAYADLNQTDHSRLETAALEGRLEVQTGV